MTSTSRVSHAAGGSSLCSLSPAFPFWPCINTTEQYSDFTFGPLAGECLIPQCKWDGNSKCILSNSRNSIIACRQSRAICMADVGLQSKGVREPALASWVPRRLAAGRNNCGERPLCCSKAARAFNSSPHSATGGSGQRSMSMSWGLSSTVNPAMCQAPRLIFVATSCASTNFHA